MQLLAQPINTEHAELASMTISSELELGLTVMSLAAGLQGGLTQDAIGINIRRRRGPALCQGLWCHVCDGPTSFIAAFSSCRYSCLGHQLAQSKIGYLGREAPCITLHHTHDNLSPYPSQDFLH